MAYAINEYEFWNNPKVKSAGKDAALMYLAGNSYCNQYMTDGLIIFAVIPGIAGLAFQEDPDDAIQALVDNHLWIKVANGYKVHDYLKYNKSKAEIEGLKKRCSAAGKASAKARASTDESELVEQDVEQDVQQNNRRTLNPISYSNTKNIKTDAVVVDSERGEVFRAYENEIGMLTPFIADNIQDAEQTYPDGWVVEAIHEAAINNGKSWKYISAILQNWKQNGFKAPRPSQNTNRKPAPHKVPVGHELDDILDGVPIFAEDK